MSWELSRRREESKRSNKQKTCRLPHRRRAYGSKSTCDPVTQRPAIRLPTNKNSRSRGESDLKCQRCSCKEDDVEKRRQAKAWEVGDQKYVLTETSRSPSRRHV